VAKLTMPLQKESLSFSSAYLRFYINAQEIEVSA